MMEKIETKQILTKEDKESWIIEHFLRAGEREKEGRWTILKHPSPPKPDFLVIDPSGNRWHIEVTELLEWPSENEGHQRFLADQFDELLEEVLTDKRYYGLSLALYKYDLPLHRFLKNHADNIITQLDAVLQKNRKNTAWKTKINSDGHQVRVEFLPERVNDKPQWLFFMYGVSGVSQTDREAYLKGLNERIADKAASHYELEYPAKLVIYDNSRYSMFVNDIQQEVLPHFQKCARGQFREIWLLSSNGGMAFRVT